MSSLAIANGIQIWFAKSRYRNLPGINDNVPAFNYNLQKKDWVFFQIRLNSHSYFYFLPGKLLLAWTDFFRFCFQFQVV